VALAERIGAPVISLDRIQCCPDLAVGSGRPSNDELKGTRRHYLVDRSLSQGIISSMEANAILKRLVAEQGVRNQHIILEGGSVSLLDEMWRDEYWSSFLWTFKYFEIGDPDRYLVKARQRVHEMFDPKDGRASILEELDHLWRTPTLRAALEDIDGYRCAIRFARQRGMPISALLGMDAGARQELVDAIAEEYLLHAQWQMTRLRPAPPSWRPAAGGIGPFPTQV
jgi:tRNA A37 N6-isopentenylltransferase MiaA